MVHVLSFAAGTQTLLTFPVNFDLYQLLGPGFNYPEEKSAAAAACDLGNSSLRRKLFGQPDRQVRPHDNNIFCDLSLSLLSSSLRALFLFPLVSPVREVMMHSLQWKTLRHRPYHSHLYKIS